MRLALTDVLLRSLKPPARGRLQITDTKSTGLMLRVTSGGAFSWCFRCHDPSAGRPTPRITLGPYPAVSLAEARTRAAAMRAQVLAGTGLVAKPKQRASAESRTFAHLVGRYLEEHVRRRLKSAVTIENRLARHVLPAWGSRRFDGITRADVVELVEALITAGKPVEANRVQVTVSGVFTFAIDAGLTDHNPVARLKRRGVETPATRVLSDGEVRLFWAGTMTTSTPMVGLALRLALLTGARGGEIAGIALGELHELGDPGSARWLLPTTRSKNKRERFIPLSPLARATVLEARGLNGAASHYLFPSPLDADKPMLPAHLSGAMAEFTTTLRGDVAGGLSLDAADAAATWIADPPTPHDLRRTVATRLAELRIVQEDRDAVLGHAPQGVGKKHYDKYARAREVRHALDTWAAALAEIFDTTRRQDAISTANGARGKTVVPLR